MSKTEVSSPFIQFPVQVHDGFVPRRTDYKNWRGKSCPCQGDNQKPLWGGGFRDKRGRFFHAAVDIMAAEGTPIYAPCDGIIPVEVKIRLDGETKNRPGVGEGEKAGIYFVFQSKDGHWQYYGSHLVEVVAKPGDELKAGDLIGYVGATGNARKGDAGCPHLHLSLTARTAAARRYARRLKWDLMTDGKVDPVPGLRILYNAGGWKRENKPS